VPGAAIKNTCLTVYIVLLGFSYRIFESAGSRSESRRKEKHCCGAAEGDGERKRGKGSRAEKLREKISDGEQGTALGRGK